VEEKHWSLNGQFLIYYSSFVKMLQEYIYLRNASIYFTPSFILFTQKAQFSITQYEIKKHHQKDDDRQKK
jgi:hypothetical protein